MLLLVAHSSLQHPELAGIAAAQTAALVYADEWQKCTKHIQGVQKVSPDFILIAIVS